MMTSFLRCLGLLAALSLAGCASSVSTSGGPSYQPTSTNAPALEVAMAWCGMNPDGARPTVHARWGVLLPNSMSAGMAPEHFIARYLDRRSSGLPVLSPSEACVGEYMTSREGDRANGPQVANFTARMWQSREQRAAMAWLYAGAAQVLSSGWCGGNNRYWKLDSLSAGGNALTCADLAVGVFADDTRYLPRRQPLEYVPTARASCMWITFVPAQRSDEVTQCVSPEAYDSIMSRMGTGEPSLCIGGYEWVRVTSGELRRTCKR